jgi:Fur family transcriptional regulator, iron response regulator
LQFIIDNEYHYLYVGIGVSVLLFWRCLMDGQISFAENRREEPRHRVLCPEGCLPTLTANSRVLFSQAKLRPTRQKIALATLLFGKGHRHVSADILHAEALQQGTMLSLATVYNTLNQFVEAGLLRRVAMLGTRAYFDTDTGDHQHFYIEDEGRIIDIPATVRVGELPQPPEGYRVVGVDVVVRLRKVSAADWFATRAMEKIPPDEASVAKAQCAKP